MFLRCGILALIAAGPAFAENIALTRVGDPWSYFAGTSEPSSATGAWQLPGFNDSAWRTGRSGFSAGYATAESTPLPDAPANYPSVYFRRTFPLTKPDQVKWLTLRIDYSDGFVAYLNGQEIARRNLAGTPGTPVPFHQLATNYHFRGEPEEIDVNAGVRALIAGLNTLAVQLHNARPSSAGLCFSADLMANFNRAPYLQNMSSNQVQIIWKTPVASDTQVAFGTGSKLDASFYDASPVTTHVATLTNLAPGAVYQYQVSSSADDQIAQADIATFRTFSPAGSLRFIVFGDGGWNALPQYQLAQLMKERKPDLVLETGDIVYPSFTRALADLRCFSVFQPHMGSTPYFFAFGNHDLYAGPSPYLEAFYLPTNSVPLAEHMAVGTSPEHYYSFDHGDAHFTVLFVPFISQHQVAAGDLQYRWLTNDLAATRQPWKIVVFHVPMNSSSAHRFDDFNFNGLSDRLEIRDVLLPVFSRYGVQLVLNGHEHGYERFNPTNGVHAVTTAGGGQHLYGFSALDEASALYWARYHCVQVTIEGNTLNAEALSPDGEVFDRFTIQRQLPVARGYNATWHSPVVETRPADDGDGNLLGQSFDLTGEAIPTLTGQFSNLGQVRVNNDRSHLYLGFEQVMIYGDNSIFLFLEVPGWSGVSSMLGLGNGHLDPNGEAVDALDFLENLSFTNFHPSVACVVGDEFVDVHSRTFARRALPQLGGQGAFELQPGFGDVPGLRLQQFHLSPQLAGPREEENANLIELAIPFAALGGLRPGESIRIGAVVGGGEFSLGLGTRFLDSGFLGARMIGSGLGPVVLEGIPITLAADPDPDEDGDGLGDAAELALGTNPTNPDSDGDHLPDGWEVNYGLDPLSGGTLESGQDSDGDGSSAYQEFLAGTDPRDPESVLKITWRRTSLSTLRISWKANRGRKYFVQSSQSVLSTFLDLPGASFPLEPLSDNQVCELDVDYSTRAGHLYRVRVSTE